MPIRVEVFETQLQNRDLPANADADVVPVPAGGSMRVTLMDGTQFVFWHRPDGGGMQVVRAKAGLRDIITNDQIQRFTVASGTPATLVLATVNAAVPKPAFRIAGTPVVLIVNPNPNQN